MKIKLAEALLRRKELSDKVIQLKAIDQKGLFEVKAARKKVTEDVDDIIAQVPKLSIEEVTATYDYYAKQLRLIDAAIQQANWTTEVDVPNDIMKNHSETKKE